MRDHQLINQTSGDVELFTPPAIMAVVRRFFGGIDLDPASCAKANEIVKAKRFFTVVDDGLSQPWHGRTWLNHPFGKSELACKPNCKKKTCVKRGYHLTEDKPGNEHWIGKLVAEYQEGHVIEACCITFASTSEAWFNPLLVQPQCYLVPRTNYISPDGKTQAGVTKGSVITYFGCRLDEFCQQFSPLGVIKVRWADGKPYLTQRRAPSKNQLPGRDLAGNPVGL